MSEQEPRLGHALQCFDEIAPVSWSSSYHAISSSRRPHNSSTGHAMTSLLDLEHPRTDYFQNITADAVEPSSSPSDDSSPYRTFLEEQLRGGVSPAPRHNAYHPDDDRKHSRSSARDSRESRKINALLILTSERLDQETRRANDAERKTGDAVNLLRSTVQEKLFAQQEAARVGEELRLYKLQYENAQREIFKAQDLINRIEAQRQEAEEAAARARSTARKLKEQNVVMLAREEGRQLGYQEGLARGRSIAYEDAHSRRLATPMQEDYVVTEEDSASEEEEEEPIRLAEPASNIRLKSPFAVPIREQEPQEPIRRPSSRSTRSRHDTEVRAPPLFAPSVHSLNISSPVRSVPPPIPSPIRIPSAMGGRSRSNSQPFGRSPINEAPPDSWIPVADANNFISMPPPHHMSSPAISPAYSTQTLPKPAPPQQSNSEPITSIRVRDYAYGSGSRKRQEEPRPIQTLQPPQRTTTPVSQTSTRISDYGLLTSPPEERPPLPPVRSSSTMPVFREVVTEPNTPGHSERAGWKYDPRSWAKKKIEEREFPSRASGLRHSLDSPTQSPVPVPPPPTILDSPHRPQIPTQSSSSTSSVSSGSSGSSETTRQDVRQDPRKNPEGGSRTPLGWLFKKRYRDRFTEDTGNVSSGRSSVIVDISIVSPSNSSPSHGSGTPTEISQRDMLSPEYREVPLPRPKPPPKPEPQQPSQKQAPSLPPLADLNDLISPGAGNPANLPIGFVPNLQPPTRSSSRASERPIRTPSRTASRNHKRSATTGTEEGYETAPLPPGVSYPAPPPSPSLGVSGAFGRSGSIGGRPPPKTRSRSHTVSSMDSKNGR